MTRYMPATAFGLSSGKKRPREHRKDHLEFISRLPSVISGQRGVHVAHIRYGSLPHGKRPVGAGEKSDDCWTVPLTPDEHLYANDSQHMTGDERGWWQSHGIDPIIIAALLFCASGDDERGELIIANARWLSGSYIRATTGTDQEAQEAVEKSR